MVSSVQHRLRVLRKSISQGWDRPRWDSRGAGGGSSIVSGSLSPGTSRMCFLSLCPTPPCGHPGRAEASAGSGPHGGCAQPTSSPELPSPPCSHPALPCPGWDPQQGFILGCALVMCGADCRNMGFPIIFFSLLTFLDIALVRGGYEFNYAVGLEALGIKERLFQRSNWMLIWERASSLWSAPKGRGNIVSSIYCGIYNINDLKNTSGISVRCLF